MKLNNKKMMLASSDFERSKNRDALRFLLVCLSLTSLLPLGVWIFDSCPGGLPL